MTSPDTHGIERLETPRLVCERMRTEHADELCLLMLHPQVVRTTWVNTNPPARSHVLDRLAHNIQHWRTYGFGLWLLRDRDSGAMVGRGGLQHTMTTGVDEVEIGWAIVPDRWGQGLATEMALASVDVGFGDLGLDEVVAFTLPHNIASWRVMEKAGLTFEREFEHAGHPHLLYRRRRTSDRRS
jgi:ribosomal-protein-alanine N-acetyltransferase